VTDAVQGAGEDHLAPAAVRDGSVSAVQAVLAGIRQPIVLILLLIAFFTTISGKPLDGFLMLTVATLLVWDAARFRLGYPPAASRSSGMASTAQSATALSASAARGAAGSARRTSQRLVPMLAGLTAGLGYAGVTGSFKRYSWPATTAVVALGCLMVAVGWHGPLRRRAELTGLALRRAWLWAAVLVGGGLWELSSLLQQPHLTTDSYSHPTISALTDPLLTSHPGRTVALGGWLLIGWFLAGR
jgi:hypothetical protein